MIETDDSETDTNSMVAQRSPGFNRNAAANILLALWPITEAHQLNQQMHITCLDMIFWRILLPGSTPKFYFKMYFDRSTHLSTNKNLEL